MQQRGSGRLNKKQLNRIAKVILAGRKNPEHKKFYIVLIVVLILWYYLLSACRKNKKVILTAFVGTGMIILGIFIYHKVEERKLDVLMEGQISRLKEIKDSNIYEGIETKNEKIEGFEALLEENSDLAGWLSIEGTQINYPVMQHIGNEDYYLDKGFDHNKNPNGSLILAEGCDIKDKNTNWIIHGHNMKSGKMFGGLEKYEELEYAKEHSLITLETKEETRQYLVMAAFYSRVFYKKEKEFKYYQFYKINQKDEFEQFYKNVKNLSIYDTGIEAVYGDQFITLSTCAYYTENGRFVVIGKRIYN